MPLDIASSTRRRPLSFPAPVQAQILVGIASEDPLVVAVLRAKLASATDLWFVSDPARAEILVWDPPPGRPGELPELPTVLGLGHGGASPTVIALVDESTDPMPLLAAGVGGLISHEADSSRLHMTILAAQLGLCVLDEDPADAIVAAWSPPKEPEPGPTRARPTPRELEVLELLAEGLSNRAIGAGLGISPHTVKFHVDALLDKLAARSRTQAVVKAMRAGLIF